MGLTNKKCRYILSSTDKVKNGGNNNEIYSRKRIVPGNFDQYGSFSRLINPDKVSVGPAIHEFFCDQLVYYTASTSPVGISTSRVLKRPVVVDTTEIHRCCGEVILPLDGDVYIHVGPRSDIDDPPYEKFELFRVPQGTAVYMRPGTWHFAAFPCTQDCVNVMVLLPERTYANDCIVAHIPKDRQIRLAE